MIGRGAPRDLVPVKDDWCWLYVNGKYSQAGLSPVPYILAYWLEIDIIISMAQADWLIGINITSGGKGSLQREERKADPCLFLVSIELASVDLERSWSALSPLFGSP